MKLMVKKSFFFPLPFVNNRIWLHNSELLFINLIIINVIFHIFFTVFPFITTLSTLFDIWIETIFFLVIIYILLFFFHMNCFNLNSSSSCPPDYYILIVIFSLTLLYFFINLVRFHFIDYHILIFIWIKLSHLNAWLFKIVNQYF